MNNCLKIILLIFFSNFLFATSIAKNYLKLIENSKDSFNNNEIVNQSWTKDYSIYSSWDSELNDWRLSYKSSYEYDNHSHLILKKDSTRNVANTEWIRNGRTTYTYTLSGKLETEIEEFWDVMSGKWENYSKLTFTYIAENLTTYLVSNWNSLNEEWEHYYKIEYAYNGNQLKSETFYLWNGQPENWEEYTMYEYEKTDNIEEILMKSFNKDLDDWQNSQKTIFVYLADERISDHTVLYWDETRNDWYFYEKWESEFLIDNTEEKTYSKYDYEEHNWNVVGKEIYNFNTQNNITLYQNLYWDRENSNWINSMKTIYSYDEEYNLNNIINSYWKNEINEWENSSKEENYWKNYVGINTISSNIYISLFPNPAEDFIIINCKEIIQRIEIYNQSGLLVVLSDQEMINLQNISPGIYYTNLHLKSGKQYNISFIKQ
jgi:type IX secretion system substrate protein